MPEGRLEIAKERRGGPGPAGEARLFRTVAGSALALLAVAIWSGWLVITRVAVTSTLSAEDLSALRFGSAGLILHWGPSTVTPSPAGSSDPMRLAASA